MSMTLLDMLVGHGLCMLCIALLCDSRKKSRKSQSEAGSAWELLFAHEVNECWASGLGWKDSEKPMDSNFKLTETKNVQHPEAYLAVRQSITIRSISCISSLNRSIGILVTRVRV
jgi:hypothetical protein